MVGAIALARTVSPTRLLIGVQTVSGSVKMTTALELACGMIGTLISPGRSAASEANVIQKQFEVNASARGITAALINIPKWNEPWHHGAANGITAALGCAIADAQRFRLG